tara:strand:+ start:384 stop:929 length:546 start_codon:yes stop_codon:yes gene_type:complete
MKYLILLIISFNVLSNTIPESELIKALNKEPNAGSLSCKDLPNEKCYDFSGIDWNYAELVDNYVLDYVSQKQYESCLDEADCDDKFSRIVCSEGTEIKNYETLSVYCAVNVMKVEGKKLVESESKKAAFKAARKAEKDAEEAKIAAKKALKLAIKEDIKTATTVAKLKALIEKLIEAQDEK